MVAAITIRFFCNRHNRLYSIMVKIVNSSFFLDWPHPQCSCRRQLIFTASLLPTAVITAIVPARCCHHHQLLAITLTIVAIFFTVLVTSLFHYWSVCGTRKSLKHFLATTNRSI